MIVLRYFLKCHSVTIAWKRMYNRWVNNLSFCDPQKNESLLDGRLF